MSRATVVGLSGPQKICLPGATSLRTRVAPARALSADDVRAWARLQQADPTSDSPFFHPEFALAVADARLDVEVCVVEMGGEAVCFFPFQRRTPTVARPLAAPTSDFHGPIILPGLDLNAQQLMRESGLAAWHFTDLTASKPGFGQYEWAVDRSPCIDLSEGYDGYRAQRRAAGSQTLRKTMQKHRKLCREVGDVRFELVTRHRHILRQLLEWKSQQCHERGHVDLFSFDWMAQLLENLLQHGGTDFSAHLATLSVDNELQAAFYCLQSRDVLHVWIIAHNPAVSKYSPGYQLLAYLLEQAESLGVRRIDLGRGGEQFKANFANSSLPVVAGSVDLRLMQRQVGRAWYHLRRAAGQSSLRRHLNAPWSFAKRLRDHFLYG